MIMLWLDDYNMIRLCNKSVAKSLSMTSRNNIDNNTFLDIWKRPNIMKLIRKGINKFLITTGQLSFHLFLEKYWIIYFFGFYNELLEENYFYSISIHSFEWHLHLFFCPGIFMVNKPIPACGTQRSILGPLLFL